MSRDRKAGGKVKSLAFPNDTWAPVYRTLGKLKISNYNDDGSYQAEDRFGESVRLVRKSVLIREETSDPVVEEDIYLHCWSKWGFTFEPGDGSYHWERHCSTCGMGEFSMKDPGE